MEEPIPIVDWAKRAELRRRARRENGLIPIGQFAAASRLSLKALRMYDQNGLLTPRRVDPDSGYRYYELAQLRTATMIGLLRRAGMGLAEIRAVIADPAQSRLDEHRARLEHELAEQLRILDYVREYLEETQMFEVKTRQIPDQPYVSRTVHMKVDGLSNWIGTTIDELMAANEPAGPPFAIFHGQVNETDDGPVELGVPTAGGDKTLPGGELAYAVASGPACAFPEILGAYDAVAGWAKANDRDLVGPPREIYLERDVWEIAWLVS
jgi:DNA-binding transcriptional MerR regulator